MPTTWFDAWIPTEDGVLLSARVWMPEGGGRVPVVFEMNPYRLREDTLEADFARNTFLAQAGIAAVRVNCRGSGESTGILEDEYLPQEQKDALTVIDWLVAQPWCSGNVGMHGISWSGFNSLQTAAHGHPALKAIQVIGCSDDRYNDDVHYMGGCLLTSQMLPWSMVMLLHNAHPPNPAVVGPVWYEMWMDRLNKCHPFAEIWLSHQRKDAYWLQGSVGEHLGRIQIPVFMVGGLADAYNNGIPRMMTGLSGPRQALIGPWSHTYPDEGPPGPTVNFLTDTVHWWNRWLKGEQTPEAPLWRSWVQQYEPPQDTYEDRKGYWLDEPAWPSPNIVWVSLFPAEQGLSRHVPEQTEHALPEALGNVYDSGEWGSYGTRGEYPSEQTPADQASLTFTTTEFLKPMVLVGNPEVDLVVSADQQNALIVARLTDVAPDGTSVLITWGQLNLSHRDSDESPTDLIPGQPYQVTVSLSTTGYEIAPGHRLRLAVASSYLRHAWPSPTNARVTLHTGNTTRVRLPVRRKGSEERAPNPPPGETLRPPDIKVLREGKRKEFETHEDGVHLFRATVDSGRTEYPSTHKDSPNTVMDSGTVEMFRVQEGNPLSAVHRVASRLEVSRGTQVVRVRAEGRISCDAMFFYVHHRLNVWLADRQVFSREWDEKIPRDHM